MKALLVLMTVLLLLLVAGLWVGPGSFPDRWRLEKKIQTLEESNKSQQEMNRKIQAELDDVAAGNDAVEERARSELGMTRKGETFFEVILQPEPEEPPSLDGKSELKAAVKADVAQADVEKSIADSSDNGNKPEQESPLEANPPNQETDSANSERSDPDDRIKSTD